MAATAARPARRRLPILEGLLPIDPSRVPSELIAGATLAALAIPETMGYTKIAGMPVITGLYTILIPILLFAVFGSSRHLVVGADSATAAVMAAGLLGMGATAESPQYVALAGLVALMCAVFLIAARVLRLGFIANFLSRSVLIGFLTGVGIQVAMGQLAGVLGVSDGSGTTLEKFATTLRNIPDTSIPTLLVSITVIAIIVGAERINRKIPGALIAVVGMIVLSYALDFAARGITVLGTVPGGLPPIGLPQDVITSDNVVALLPTVFSCFVVILAQSAATSRAYAVKYDDSFDENVDLIGLGLANAGAGLSGTFVVNGSPTKTEMVDSAGGRSQLAQLTTAAAVAAVLLFLTAPLAYMPNAVLAAVVLLIGVRLVDYRGLYGVLRLRSGEFVVAALTAATVVVIGVEQGIILAIVLSIVEHLYHAYRPHDRLLRIRSTGRLEASPLSEGTQAAAGLVVYHFGAGLFYANAARFTEEVLAVVESAQPPVRWFCINGSAMADIDFSGAGAIRQVLGELRGKGITLVMCEFEPPVRALLDRYGLTEEIGHEHFYDFMQDVIEAYQQKVIEANQGRPTTPGTGSG
ncbi:MAG TPA: SulP family inorganic anion transporter [Candidatus Dormibacteraeota bacterium]|nr:SulP family inorganic anion transporter [Candidatus Dormibacteraeota bacterium]